MRADGRERAKEQAGLGQRPRGVGLLRAQQALKQKTADLAAPAPGHGEHLLLGGRELGQPFAQIGGVAQAGDECLDQLGVRASDAGVDAMQLRHAAQGGDWGLVQPLPEPHAMEPGTRSAQPTNSGASTSVIVESSLMSTCSDGPAVSLNGSPTVSPTTDGGVGVGALAQHLALVVLRACRAR